MNLQASTLPPALPTLDQKMCKKYIECLSNIAFAMDAQARTMNKSNTKYAIGQKDLMLDGLKNGLPIYFQKDFMQVIKPVLSYH